jgi:TetR/AcrR family transcriptional regulator, fatty acid metabolism regulator protein
MAAPAADKRRLLLDAAIRVFAAKGYHACRVGDIAKEADVSYGLLYHYFGSKEAVLETIFRATWSDMLTAVRGIEAAGGPARDQLRRVATVVLGAWKLNPDLVRLLVREVARSPQLQHEIAEIRDAMDALERIVRRGQESGEFRVSLDSRLAAWVVYGALEETLTGWVMGAPPADGDVERAVATVSSLLCDGLVARID